jgi:hypothetical protein
VPTHPRGNSLGILAILLGGFGIVVGLEEMAAGALSGGWDHGSGSNPTLEKAKDGVLLVGGVLTVMSVFLLVVGILAVNGRGAMMAKVWGVFGIVVAIGLVIDAVSNQELVDELGKNSRFVYPGYLADLGSAKIPVLASLVVLPIVMLVRGPRPRPLEAALAPDETY